MYGYSKCLAILQGHTSLVGQLQLRHNTLVTGGSDGSVRVWSLQTFTPIHRLAAHDNSVTSLQFDDSRIVSGGSDGRVKVWDLARGTLVRELGQPAEAVWRVVFEEEKAVVLASRGGKTVMEVWSFAPPADDAEEAAVVRRYGSLSSGGIGGLMGADTRRAGAASPALSDIPFSEPSTSPSPMAGPNDGQLGGVGPSGLRDEVEGGGVSVSLIDDEDVLAPQYYDDVGRIEPVASVIPSSGVNMATTTHQEADVVMSDGLMQQYQHHHEKQSNHDRQGVPLLRTTAIGNDEDAGDPMSTVNSPMLSPDELVERRTGMFGRFDGV